MSEHIDGPVGRVLRRLPAPQAQKILTLLEKIALGTVAADNKGEKKDFLWFIEQIAHENDLNEKSESVIETLKTRFSPYSPDMLEYFGKFLHEEIAAYVIREYGGGWQAIVHLSAFLLLATDLQLRFGKPQASSRAYEAFIR